MKKMSKRYKSARLMNNLKLTEAAEKLGISQPTLSAWESERKSASIDALEKMADLYGVTTDYLLGRIESNTPDPKQPIPKEIWMIYDGKPLWSNKHGWLLVNSSGRQLVFSDGRTLPFEDADILYLAPPLFAEPQYPKGLPLPRPQIPEYAEVWVEPISPDLDLKNELRGWYYVKERWVENEHGTRLYLDTYGSKWLAFVKK